MGQGNGVFSKDELEEYTDLTYLSRGEVLQAFSKFSRIDPDKVSQNRHAKISCDKVRNSTEELKLNPFGDRICSVFRYAKITFLNLWLKLDCVNDYCFYCSHTIFVSFYICI